MDTGMIDKLTHSHIQQPKNTGFTEDILPKFVCGKIFETVLFTRTTVSTYNVLQNNAFFSIIFNK